jgi:hypothetical protein
MARTRVCVTTGVSVEDAALGEAVVRRRLPPRWTTTPMGFHRALSRTLLSHPTSTEKSV